RGARHSTTMEAKKKPQRPQFVRRWGDENGSVPTDVSVWNIRESNAIQRALTRAKPKATVRLLGLRDRLGRWNRRGSRRAVAGGRAIAGRRLIDGSGLTLEVADCRPIHPLGGFQQSLVAIALRDAAQMFGLL